MLALPSETALVLCPSERSRSLGSITISDKLNQKAENGVLIVSFPQHFPLQQSKQRAPLNIKQWRQLSWIFPLTIRFGFFVSFVPFNSPETHSSSCHWTTTPPCSLCHRLGLGDSSRWSSHWTERLRTSTPSRYCTTKFLRDLIKRVERWHQGAFE